MMAQIPCYGARTKGQMDQSVLHLHWGCGFLKDFSVCLAVMAWTDQWALLENSWISSPSLVGLASNPFTYTLAALVVLGK
jgi:hypothetical protein